MPISHCSSLASLALRLIAIIALTLLPAAGRATAAPDGSPTAAEWQGIRRLMQRDVLLAPPVISVWQPEGQLNAPDAAGDNGLHFGYDVAIDGSTLVVGAYVDSSPLVDAGSVYVFEKPAAGWGAVTQYAKLTASDAAASDLFGKSVAIDGSTIVVGAPYDDTATITNHGAVYVFVKPGAQWVSMTQTAKLTASDKTGQDRLGWDVGISGGTVAVGAPYHDGNAKDEQGAVYVFERPSGGWAAWTGSMAESAELYGYEGTPGDHLGTAVAISGETIIAGAPDHNLGGQINPDSGVAYIFRKDGGWTSGTEHARLAPSDSAELDYFGLSVAIDGNVAVVGSPGDPSPQNAANTSAVYVYRRPPGDWAAPDPYTENARLTASDGVYSDNFGRAVDISGSIIVVGANFDKVNTQDKQGSAYVYIEPAGGWANHTENARLLAGDGVTLDEFGFSVSISGLTIAAGAPRNSVQPSGYHLGSTYLFKGIDWSDSIYLPLLTKGS